MRRLKKGKGERPARICLAASGGGHVRQLLDLEPVWSRYDAFFVTEPTALGHSLAMTHRTHFVTHVAMGQARLGRPIRMLFAALRNFWESARIVIAERPDFVISTGAGAVFFVLLWARLLGARIIAIESFARFDRPSLFMRLAAPFAHEKVVQSAALGGRFREAKVFDPLRVLDGPRPPKQPLMFVTVGATLPFDRMINSVAKLKNDGHIPERVLAQVGLGGAAPSGIETVETLKLSEMTAVLKDADLVICHGGTGSLITALREQCRVVAMPRLFELGEHYDNHQAEITSAFEQRGLVVCVRDEADLNSAIQRARAAVPIGATTEPTALMEWLEQTLERWSGRGSVNPA